MSSLDDRAPSRVAVFALLAAATGLLATGRAHAAPQFAPPGDLTNTVASPRLLAPLDLDGDGDDDILAAEADGAVLHWIESRGGGAFGRIEPLLRAPGQRALWSFADVDGDGDVDAVAVTASPVKVYVFDAVGAGAFAPPDRIAALGGEAVGLDIGDVTGDGLVDIVVATDAGTVLGKGIFALRGLGGGTFWPAVRIAPWSQGVGGIVTGPIELVDLDRDTDLDLLVTDDEAARFVWFRNQGSGASIGPLVIGDDFHDVTSIVAGDLDGDGDNDLVAVGAPNTGDTGFELRTYIAAGFGAFGPAFVVDRAVDGSPSPPTLCDLDADGDVDVALPHRGGKGPMSDGPVWFENDGSGPRPGPRPLPTVAGWRPVDVRRGDLDGDGVFDLVYACSTQQIGWCRGVGAQGFEPPVEITRRVDGAVDVALLDVDRDGDPDVLVAENATGAVVVLENHRADGFERLPPILDGLAGLERIEAGDLDGDGDDDLALVSFTAGWLRVSENAPAGPLPAATLHTFAPASDGTLTIADVDGDGDLDLVISSLGTPQILWFEQDGGRLVAPPQIALSGQPNARDLVVRDIDADGANDIVVTGPGFGGSVGFFRGLGAGAFSARQPIPTINFEPRNVVVFDADGDGDLDLAIGGAGWVFPLLEWIPQVAPGQFGAADYVGSAIQGWMSIEAADVDLDGDVDLVGAPRIESAEPFQLDVYTSPFGGAPRVTRRPLGISSFLTGDIDQDGDVDVLMTSERGDSVTLLAGTARGRIGAAGCEGVASSLGHPSRIEVVGTARATDNAVRVRTYGMPRDVLTLFLTSRAAGHVVSPGGSAGTLCLGGGIGRFVGPGQVRTSGSTGVVELAVDLTAIPQPLGTVSGVAGETWRFQAWFRDAVGGQATSNFSGSTAIELR